MEIDVVYLTSEAMQNKLFCSFSTKDKLEERLDEINRSYSILFGKIFVLETKESSELLCTYNIELQDSATRVLPNTILLHRKKESNTLYTINALNIIIKSQNQGVLDSKYSINWDDYNNSVLLTQGNDLKRLNTVIYKVVKL
jgi:hypothetical protein